MSEQNLLLGEECCFIMLVGELKAENIVNKVSYCERPNTALVQNVIVTQIHIKIIRCHILMLGL